ncbi:heat shock factor protein 2 isoform X2 [Macrobrachium rosenbergii]|uniref:heat shock factor protein 2 isoform X2 n=1 Tax=Macrobrachium rosenbergii TaxID=79674 RepID=UPI0034D6E02E
MHAIEGTSNVPAFLTKLWRLVDDRQTNDLICWTENGRSFIIQNQARFARELLPQYYKHNNMASFVRQLNMYGFHKVASADSGGLRVEKDEMEFAHPAFQQGREDLIENIRRKQQRRLASDGMDLSQIPTSRVGLEDNKKLGKLLNDVRDMKRDHDTMSTKLLSLKRENEALWREYASMRQKFSKQQQIIEKLIHFLVAMVKSPSKPIIPKRKFGHLALEGIEEAASLNTIPQLSQNVEVLDGLSSGTMGGAQIHEVTDLIDSDNPSAIPEIFTPDPANTALEMEEIPVNESDGTILLVDGEPFLEASDLSLPSTSVPIKATNVRSPSGSNLWPEIQNSKLLDEAPLSPELLNTVDPSDVTQSFKYAAAPPGSTVTQNPTILTTSSAGTRLVSGPGKVQIAGKAIKKSPGRGKLKAMKISDSKSTTQPSVSTVAQPSLSFVAQPSRNSITQPNMSVAVPDKNFNKVFPDISAITDLAQYSKGSLTGRNNTTNTLENEIIGEQADEDQWLTRVLPDISAITDLAQYSKDSLTARNNTTSTVENEIVDEQPDENHWLTRGDLQTHMDDMQNSIESLQEIMSAGTFNLDPTVLLSMFGSDDTLPELDSMAAATGNEISLYNPSLLDLAEMADDPEDDPMKFLNRSSVASTSSSSAAMTPSSYSSSAKSKSGSSKVPLAVSIKEEKVCDELSTPKILTPVQSPIFCGKKRRK